MTLLQHLLRLAVAPVLGALLSACAGKPPVPDWQMNAHGAVERATEAYLSGNSRVADQEWARARAEVARTGRPDLLARVELMRCAAQVASLQMQPCEAFEPLRADAPPPEQAYADYLAGRATSDQGALLPQAQRAALASPQAIAAITDPLARLVAAGVALRAGRATPEVMALATETASAQGWRRPLLAWLLLRAERAGAAGDAALEGALRRRAAVVESGGTPVTKLP